MAKKKKEEEPTRYIWVKCKDRTVERFESYEEADRLRRSVVADLKPGDDSLRVRVCKRSRTGLFDVVVKVKTAVKDEPRPQKPAESGTPPTEGV